MARRPRGGKTGADESGSRSQWHAGIQIPAGFEPPIPRHDLPPNPPEPPEPRVPTRKELAEARKEAKRLAAGSPPLFRPERYYTALLSLVQDAAAEAALDALRRHGIFGPGGPMARRKALSDRRTAWIKQFGERIQAERERLGLTQGALAIAADMPQSHLSQLENGKSEARLSTLYLLAKVLQIRPGMLLHNP